MVGRNGKLVGILHQHGVAINCPHRKGGRRCGGGQEGMQAVQTSRIKNFLKVAADERPHLEGAVVILGRVLGSAHVHAHQDAQLGLGTKPLVAGLAVHPAQVIQPGRGAVAVLDTIKAMQVGGSFHPADDKICRDAIAGVGHGNIFNNVRPGAGKQFGGMQHRRADFLRQGLFLQLIGIGIGEDNPEVVGGKPNAHAAHTFRQCANIIRHIHQCGSAIVRICTSNCLQHQGGIGHIASDRSGTIKRGGKGNQPITGDAPIGRLHPHHAAKCSRLADGSGGVGTNGERRFPGSHAGSGTA